MNEFSASQELAEDSNKSSRIFSAWRNMRRTNSGTISTKSFLQPSSKSMRNVTVSKKKYLFFQSITKFWVLFADFGIVNTCQQNIAQFLVLYWLMSGDVNLKHTAFILLGITKMYRLGGETDSAIRWRKRTGVMSSRGTAEGGCWELFSNFR